MFTRSRRHRKIAALLSFTSVSAVVLGSVMSAAAAADDDTVPPTGVAAEVVDDGTDQGPAETPVVEVSETTEAPVAEVPETTEAPIVEPPETTEAPIVETPETDTPVVETPIVETPETDTPETDRTPVVETPGAPVVETLGAPVVDVAAKKDGGAVFTTDVNSEPVNANIYASKDDVYLNGGPDQQGDRFPDGTYFVQVTEPDGTVLGSGSIAITGGNFHYQLSSILVKASDGSPGYDDTSNPGGEYKVWVSTEASFPQSASKTDNFKVVAPELPEPGTVIVGKYYDANTDGVWTVGEPWIANWPIHYTAADGSTQTMVTEANGHFTINEVDPGTYPFAEVQAQAPWMQTGPMSRTHEVIIVDGETVEIAFGNVAIGSGGGTHHTIGFWSNKNGKAQVALGGEGTEITALAADNLVGANGMPFDPSTYGDVPSWLLNASATNMKYMLSAQLAAMHLSVVNGFVSGGSYIYAPGVPGANANGFATVQHVMNEANTALLGGDRASQEAIKNALDKANNNTNFVVPFGSIPTPVFA